MHIFQQYHFVIATYILTVDNIIFPFYSLSTIRLLQNFYFLNSNSYTFLSISIAGHYGNLVVEQHFFNPLLQKSAKNFFRSLLNSDLILVLSFIASILYPHLLPGEMKKYLSMKLMTSWTDLLVKTFFASRPWQFISLLFFISSLNSN